MADPFDVRSGTDPGTVLFAIDPATGNVTLAGTLTSPTGAVRAAGADVVVATAGRGVQVKEGANARMGTAVLVGGTVTVANLTITANTRIFLTSQADGGAPGFLRVSARSAGVSFTITSSSGTDTSTVAWLLVEPAP